MCLKIIFSNSKNKMGRKVKITKNIISRKSSISKHFCECFLNFYWSIADLQCCMLSPIQKTASVIQIHITTHFFKILFPYKPLQSIE